MKRYLLFVFQFYYPNGGWDDFKGSFDTVEEAVKEAKMLIEEQHQDGYHVVDSVSGGVVERNHEGLGWSY